MKLAIIGSRTFNNFNLLLDTMNLFFKPHHLFDVLISGGAQGADSLGERWAKYYNISIEQYLPNWKEYGKIAGFHRNQLIVDACDMVMAFWDGKSRGTADTILKARIAKKPTLIIYF